MNMSKARSPFLSQADLAEKEILPGYKVRFVHTANMTIAYYEIKAGAPFPEHSHANEQISNVIRGKFELVIDGESKVMMAGDVAVIPPGVKHYGRAVTDCKIIDVFHPVREDYVNRFID